MSSSPIAELAKLLGVPILDINDCDPNVFERELGILKNRNEDVTFRHALQYMCEGFKAEVRGKEPYLVLEVKANINSGAWSVNHPDRVTLTRKIIPDVSIDCSYPIFAMGAKLSLKASEICHQGEFKALLAVLSLGQSDSINFYKNMLVYYTRSTPAATFLAHSKAICRFVAQITSWGADRMVIALPKPFEHLAKYAQSWAIDDDIERARALDAASDETLIDVVGQVAPHLGHINAYLKSHTGDEEASLGSLAETTVQAKNVLQKRQVISSA